MSWGSWKKSWGFNPLTPPTTQTLQCTVHVVEFGHFANSSYSWQQNIINFYNELNKHSLQLVQNKPTRLREDLGYLAVNRIAI